MNLTSRSSHLTLYTDGAARGNPGPAGIGFVLKSGENIIFEGKEYIGHKTNNEAEYIALILGLEKASGCGKQIQVVSDSELLVNQVRGEYKVKQIHLKSLMEKVRLLEARFDNFEISHSLRDNNKEADRLANEAIDEYEKGERQEKKIGYQKQDSLF